MSAAASSPSPPPSGGDGQGGLGQNSPPSVKSTPRKDKKGGGGSTRETAAWSDGLLAAFGARQYLVHVRSPIGTYPEWIRCIEGEARYFADMTFTVWELDAQAGRRVVLEHGANGCSFVPFQRQMDEIVEEEQARVRRHEDIPGEEDILEDVHEEYVSIALSPATPSKPGKAVTSHPETVAPLLEAPDADSSASSSSSGSSSGEPTRSDAS